MKNLYYQSLTASSIQALKVSQGSYKAVPLVMIVVGSVLLLTSGIAHAAYLYWQTTQVRTTSLPTCFLFANYAMHDLGFQNIQQTSNEVRGISGGTFASITCLQTNPNVTGVVMVVGENQIETSSVRYNLSNKLAAEINFD